MGLSDVIGPSYSYSDNIKAPRELNMSSSSEDLENNVKGLMDYTQILSEGGGNASKASSDGGILGNRYFLKTTGKCNNLNKDSKDSDRYIYIDNVPTDDMGMGRGLIPGIAEGIASLNPLKLISAMKNPGVQDCVPVRLKITDSRNLNEEHPVSCSDIDEISAGAWASTEEDIDKIKKSCEKFISANENMRRGYKLEGVDRLGIIDDPLTNIYVALVGGLMVYIIYKLTNE